MSRSSYIYTHNHSSVTAIRHETKCISCSSSLLCKGHRKYSGRNVNLAAHTCVGLVPTCRMRELHSSSRVMAGYRGTETSLPLGLLHAFLFYILHKSELNNFYNYLRHVATKNVRTLRQMALAFLPAQDFARAPRLYCLR